MIRLIIVSVITILLFSCSLSDKSKIINEEIQDSTVKSVLDSLPKFESATLPPNYPFQLRIHQESNWHLKIDSITEREFDYEKKKVYQESKINGDSLINVLSEKFMNVIILADSCCILKGQDKDLKVCRRRPRDDHGWTGYDGIDYVHGFLILREWGYESWSYISFNPITKQYIYTSNEPCFIDNNLVFSAGNYYAEGQFQIIDIEGRRYFGFDCYEWELTGFYQEGTKFFMEFTQNIGPKEHKYLTAEYM